MSSAYPTGTVCVITHAPDSPSLGLMVAVTDRWPPSVCDGIAALHCPARAGLIVQWIEAPGEEGYYPCAWMRPIDADTDEGDDEVVRAYALAELRRVLDEAPVPMDEAA